MSVSRALASTVVVPVALLSLAACGGSEPVTAHPFVRAPGNAAGPTRGSWLAERGMFEPYRHGAHFAVQFTIRNAVHEAVTLLEADSPKAAHGLLRRIGTRLELVPRSALPARRVVTGGLRPPYGKVDLRPLVVPPGREVSVQFNFVMGDCGSFRPGARRTYNRSTLLRYRAGDAVGIQRLDLRGVQVTVTAPTAGRCPEN